MKLHTTFSYLCLCLVALSVGVFASCDNSAGGAAEGDCLNIDKSNLMRYVDCPEDTVDQMIAVGDSIYARIDSFEIAHLGMGYDAVDAELDSIYGDIIPLIVSIFDSYDEITSRESNEINSVFVWHEVARAQVAAFMCKPVSAIDEDIKTVFRAIDDILDYYSCGTQRDMNIAAWRGVMVADFELVSAYMHLMDTCNDEDIVDFVHKSYQTVLDTHKCYLETALGGYSDFPREMGVLMTELMNKRRKEIYTLVGQYLGGRIDIDDVKETLSNPTLIETFDIDLG